jgi:hypothetical protein
LHKSFHEAMITHVLSQLGMLLCVSLLDLLLLCQRRSRGLGLRLLLWHPLAHELLELALRLDDDIHVAAKELAGTLIDGLCKLLTTAHYAGEG